MVRKIMSLHKLNLFTRGEGQVLELVVSNLDYCTETARHLIPLVEALRNHDRAKVLEEVKKMSEMETKADDMHLRAVEEISGGSFFGGVREDLLGLLEDIDNIADAAKDSSRIFSQREIPFQTTDYLLKRDVSGCMFKLVDAADQLQRAILALSEKNAKTRVVELATSVERKEEEADDARAVILDNLLKNEIKADALDIILLKEFLEIADNVADSSEDGSDVLLVLISKGYT
jgi:predicted phosphate transport protein (TIGR00153 family)